MSSAPPPRFVAPPEAPLSAPERETAWKPWSAPAALVAAFVVALGGQLIIASIGSLFGTPVSDPSPAVTIIATLVQDVAFVGAAIFFALSVGPITPGQFGLRRTRLWPAVGIGAAAMLAFYLLSGLWSALIGIDSEDTLPDSLGVDRSVIALVAVCILVTVVAPLAEEFLFRGFFFGALKKLARPVAGGDHHRRRLRRDPRARDRRRVPAAADAARRAALPRALENRLAAAVHRPARDQQLDRVRRHRGRLGLVGDRAADGRNGHDLHADLLAVRRSSI